MATLAVATLGACSGVADHSATGVATSYFQRLSHRDYAGACQLLTDSLKVKLGDCPTALERQYNRLSSTEKGDLGDATVRRTVNNGKNSVHVYTQDIGERVRPTPKNTRKGKPTPKATYTFMHSRAASDMTNEKGLVLVEVGGSWEISDCGL
ncbi:hypothetical protein Pth03_61770 [Planotetraspora thailandica]|uniref:Uncharacterized protein n=1 Tax=Planotetraspora thailandica TaxID=487172 RepID=A0A8J3V6V9_9ACTN|nr:hypothetical protein Pth03_61770 [Planotetraspora thailandica]